MFSRPDVRSTPASATRTAHSDLAAPPAAGRWVAALRQALDVVAAFATLRDAEVSDGAPAAGITGGAGPQSRRPGARPSGTAPVASHPHRRPLRGAWRTRRPGAVPPAAHACVAPLPRPRAARRPDRIAPRA